MAPVVAISPVVASPRVQSQSVPPMRITGSAPATVISERRKRAETVPKPMAFCRNRAMASSAERSSKS